MNSSIQNNDYTKNENDIFNAPQKKDKKFKQPSFFLLMIKDTLIMAAVFLFGWLLCTE